MKTEKWSEIDIETLKSNYSNIGGPPLAKILNRSVQAIRTKAYLLKIKVSTECFSRSQSNPEIINSFNNAITPTSAYLLGLIWADGNVKKKTKDSGYRVSLTLKDTDFNEIDHLFSRNVGKWSIRDVKTNRNGTDCFAKTASISNRNLWDFLVLNDYLTKSGSSANKIINSIPSELKRFWWLGYFDGDGQVGQSKKYYSCVFGFASTYDQNWDFLDHLTLNLGISFKIRRSQFKNSKGSSALNYSTYDIIKLYQYFYKDTNLGLPRKRKTFEAIVQNFISQWENNRHRHFKNYEEIIKILNLESSIILSSPH